MLKRVVSLLLCLIMVASVLAGCAKKDENDKGAYIYMYLTDQVYDLDPANAYINESTLRLVSLIFDNLFVLDKDGKVKKSLAKDYEIEENEALGEYTMTITLNDTRWTDGIPVSANDVVYTYRRTLDPEASNGAASLLFDIKNARAVKEGDCSPDDLGVSAPTSNKVEIQFEGKIDYDQFLLNLTSYALVPLREDIVARTSDWAKKPATMCSSGPFRLRTVSYEDEDKQMILERNAYYYRDMMKDPWDKSVTPYRLIVDYTLSPEQIMEKYNNGEIFYVGDIPCSLVGSYLDAATVTDALSTHSYVPNQNAIVRYYNEADFANLADLKTNLKDAKEGTPLVEGEDGEKIFANADVRRALSLAIDREAIVNEIVLGKAATALVPSPVFDTDRKTSFREVGGDLLETTANMSKAQEAIAASGIDPTKFMFSISVAGFDPVHLAIAQKVSEAWNALGFHVTVKAMNVIVNNDLDKTTQEIPTDIRDDIFAEEYRAGNYDVAAIDYVAYAASAYSMLAGFAKAFSGEDFKMTVSVGEDYILPPHATGYDSEDYNELIEKVFEEKDAEKRAPLLHDAEKMLLDDMVIIPVVFNQNATLASEDLSKITSTYYCPAIFTKTKLKDYELYVPVEEE